MTACHVKYRNFWLWEISDVGWTGVTMQRPLLVGHKVITWLLPPSSSRENFSRGQIWRIFSRGWAVLIQRPRTVRCISNLLSLALYLHLCSPSFVPTIEVSENGDFWLLYLRAICIIHKSLTTVIKWRPPAPANWTAERVLELESWSVTSRGSPLL